MKSATAGPPADRVVSAPADRRRTVIDAIGRARSRIVLSLFRCTDDAVFAELGRALDRGVAVEALVTSRSKGRKKLRLLWDRLTSLGVTMHPYVDPVVKYHAKYLVVDEGPAVISSLNFTAKCFEKTVDALVLTYDPAVVAGLLALMQADCDGTRLPAGVSPRLIVGPERARAQITALITGARSSIRVIDRKLSDPALTALLDRRRDEGLLVELHTARRFGGLRTHGKLMLVDDSVAVVGSLSLAAMSLDFRREVAVIVEEPSAVAEVVQIFASAGGEITSGGFTRDDARALDPGAPATGPRPSGAARGQR